MAKSFERTALISVGALVAGFVAMAVFHPPVGVTAAPGGGARYVVDLPPEAPPSKTILPSGLEALAKSGSRATAEKVATVFADLDYDFQAVLEERRPVPRIFLASLPHDLVSVPENAARKALFLQTMLPLVLQVNEEILADRRRLWDLRTRQRLGERLPAIDRLWLAVMADQHRVKRDDIDALLKRIDIVPPSLALAQAAEESGWGTSRFSREGNAVFGEWTFSPVHGMVPGRREQGKKHRIQTFATLLESVRAYALNINRHSAYASLHRVRAAMRRTGRPIDGERLAGELAAYSERGTEYVATLRFLMAINNLRRLDGVRLHSSDTAFGSPA